MRIIEVLLLKLIVKFSNRSASKFFEFVIFQSFVVFLVRSNGVYVRCYKPVKKQTNVFMVLYLNFFIQSNIVVLKLIQPTMNFITYVTRTSSFFQSIAFFFLLENLSRCWYISNHLCWSISIGSIWFCWFT